MGYCYLSSDEIEFGLARSCRDCGACPSHECRTPDGQWLMDYAGVPVHTVRVGEFVKSERWTPRGKK